MRYRPTLAALICLCALSTTEGRCEQQESGQSATPQLQTSSAGGIQRREPHDRPRVVEIEFVGNRIFTGQELLDGTKNPAFPRTCSLVGSEYRPEIYRTCLSFLKDFLVEHGYLLPTVGEPQQQHVEGGLKVVVPVNEGARYRRGEVKIKGSKLFPPEQLLQMLDLKTGDVAIYETVRDWLGRKLKKAYADRGYVRYDYYIEPEFRPPPAGESEGVVDFTIYISEGPQFIIRSIKFAGNKSTPEEVLRGAMLVCEGETFSQEKFEESLRRLAQVGPFEEPSMWDVHLTSDDEGALLDITIKLKEKRE